MRNSREIVTHAVSVLVTFALCLSTSRAAIAAQQECKDCDCYHLPVQPKCEKCCGVELGTITSVTKTDIAVSPATPEQKATERFTIDGRTKTNAALKKGSQATVYFDKQSKVAKRVDLIEALEGLLTPGAEPDPPNVCGNMTIPKEALKIFMGRMSAVWTTGNEMAVIKFGREEVLTARRTEGGAAISAKLFSEDGKIVAQLIDNAFYINPDNFFSIERIDAHSFTVYDRMVHQVLRVRYLNPLAFEVTGVFYSPKKVPIVIGEDAMFIGGNRFQHACAANNGTVFAVD